MPLRVFPWLVLSLLTLPCLLACVRAQTSQITVRDYSELLDNVSKLARRMGLSTLHVWRPNLFGEDEADKNMCVRAKKRPSEGAPERRSA